MVNFIEPGYICISGLLESWVIYPHILGTFDCVERHDMLSILPEVGQVQHDFLRDAANIDTSTTYDLVLNQRYFLAVLSCTPGGCYSTAATTND